MQQSFYERLLKRKNLFLSITGIEHSEFRSLLPAISRSYKSNEEERKRRTVRHKQERMRSIGGGMRFSLCLEDRILLALLYIRMYTSYEFLGLFFGDMSKSNISNNVRIMRDVLEKVLPLPEVVCRRVFSMAEGQGKRRSGRIRTLEDLAEVLPELTVLIDGAEQPKRKPKNSDKRKSQYSGKKKRHTLKQIIASTPSGLIVEQSAVEDGSHHDIECYRRHLESGTSEIKTSNRLLRRLDRGFVGIEDDLDGEVVVTMKAKRGTPLTEEEKRLRREQNRRRVGVEHCIGRKKKYRIMSDEYRNKDSDYDQYSSIVAGLVNLRAITRFEKATASSFF
jgi:hypothetical protein